MEPAAPVHGLWHDMWTNLDPEFGNWLHNGQTNIKPFTLSPLMGLPCAQHGETRIEQNDTAQIRITTLFDPLSERLLEQWVPLLPSQLDLLSIGWEVSGIAMSPAEDSWANNQSYQSFYDQHYHPQHKPRWQLRLKTPTTFKSRTMYSYPSPCQIQFSAHGTDVGAPLPRAIYQS